MTSPEHRPPDLKRLVEVLSRHEVEYLVVGGVAARAYGSRRSTEDLDCLVRRTRENLQRVADALVELSRPSPRHRPERRGDGGATASRGRRDAGTIRAVNLGTDAGDIDILSDIPGLGGVKRRYEDLIASAHRLEADGVEVRTADLDDVLESKRWANRAKDREALPELEELSRRRREHE